MLVRSNQIARLFLVILPVLLPLEIRIVRAAPCLDLYKGMPSPNLSHSSRHAVLVVLIGCGFPATGELLSFEKKI